MYPQGELTRLAAIKAVIRERIGAQRQQCTVAAETALRPLAWIDRVRDLWRRFSPLIRLILPPLGLALWRHRPALLRRPRALLRWAPVVISLVQAFTRRRNPSPR